MHSNIFIIAAKHKNGDHTCFQAMCANDLSDILPTVRSLFYHTFIIMESDGEVFLRAWTYINNKPGWTLNRIFNAYELHTYKVNSNRATSADIALTKIQAGL